MKISEYKNGDAIELLADILEPTARILSDEKIKKAVQDGTNKIGIVKLLLKDHKDDILEVFARVKGVPVSEYSCNVFSLTNDLLEALNDKELLNFFTLSIPTTDGKRSI